jgi:hypothetical protein
MFGGILDIGTRMVSRGAWEYIQTIGVASGVWRNSGDWNQDLQDFQDEQDACTLAKKYPANLFHPVNPGSNDRGSRNAFCMYELVLCRP